MISFIYRILSLCLAMVIHEWAHGFASYKLGDPNPKVDGRLSLNPLKHIDPIGMLMFVILGFGFAKPVRIDSRYYKNEKAGVVITALAGPFSNFILAAIAIAINNLVFMGMHDFLYYLAIVNISLGLFNLIPIPPLDGSKVLASFLPYNAYYKYMSIERYGFFIIMGMSALGLFSGYISMGTSVIMNLLNTLF